MLKLYSNSYGSNPITSEDKLSVLDRLKKSDDCLRDQYIGKYNLYINEDFDLHQDYNNLRKYIIDRINKTAKQIRYQKRKDVNYDKNDSTIIIDNGNLMEILNKLTKEQLKELQYKLDIPDNFIRSWKYNLWKPSNRMMKQIMDYIDKQNKSIGLNSLEI